MFGKVLFLKSLAAVVSSLTAAGVAGVQHRYPLGSHPAPHPASNPAPPETSSRNPASRSPTTITGPPLYSEILYYSICPYVNRSPCLSDYFLICYNRRESSIKILEEKIVFGL